MIWWSLVLVAVAVGFVAGVALNLVVGAIVTVALVAAFQPLHLWLDRARWLKRFPELADDPKVKWIRRTW
jgi:Flp pilus assembly protein TadB